MKQEELMLSLAKLMFPSELLDHFSLVHITETPTDVVFHLDVLFSYICFNLSIFICCCCKNQLFQGRAKRFRLFNL